MINKTNLLKLITAYSFFMATLLVNLIVKIEYIWDGTFLRKTIL